MTPKAPVCKDCIAEGITRYRDPVPGAAGKRCQTHLRAVKKRRKANAHALRLASVYEMTPEEYQALYEAQGGRCFICQWATGTTKRLAVDHDHVLATEHGHDPKNGCWLCIRALLCGPCNQTIGRLGIDALIRAIRVLSADPPARAVLADLRKGSTCSPSPSSCSSSESFSSPPQP